MRKHLVLTALVLALLAGCAAASYEPAGAPTGDETLDGQVLTLLQEICDPRASEEENLRAAYDWVCNEITYRAGTADTTGGFTEDLIQELASEALEKRKGNCDSEAALMAVLLQRLGCEAQVIQGQFLREGDDEAIWVDHAWVVAEVEEQYYHFDPLYGRYYTEDRAGDYFMQSDAALEATHTWDRETVPACP